LALGKASFERQKAEEGSKVFRRSLYFVKDLPVGHVIGPDDVRRIRPRMGLAPKYLRDVLGKSTVKEVKAGTPALWEFVSAGDA
jgi:sialic acid synthase SpsE